MDGWPDRRTDISPFPCSSPVSIMKVVWRMVRDGAFVKGNERPTDWMNEWSDTTTTTTTTTIRRYGNGMKALGGVMDDQNALSFSSFFGWHLLASVRRVYTIRIDGIKFFRMSG